MVERRLQGLTAPFRCAIAIACIVRGAMLTAPALPGCIEAKNSGHEHLVVEAAMRKPLPASVSRAAAGKRPVDFVNQL